MPLLVIVVALIVFGLTMLYSASWDFSRAAYDGDAMYMFNRQLMWLGLGVVAATILAFLDYHRWRQLIVPAMAFTVVMLIVVLVMSEVRFNATRTIFNGSIQPSELAKLVSILYIAVWLYAKREMLKDITFGLIPLGVILGFVGGLIYLQPDLSAAGTVLILGAVVAGVLFAAGFAAMVAALTFALLALVFAVRKTDSRSACASRRGSSTTVNLPGVAGATNANATTLLQANNPTATTITVTGNGFSSGAACPLP